MFAPTPAANAGSNPALIRSSITPAMASLLPPRVLLARRLAAICAADKTDTALAPGAGIDGAGVAVGCGVGAGVGAGSATVTLKSALFPLNVLARIDAVPALRAVTFPDASTDATAESLLAHWIADAAPLGSLAASCAVFPTSMARLAADSVTFDGALTTFTVTVAFNPFCVLTVIFAVPAFFAVITPPDDTVATFFLLVA